MARSQAGERGKESRSVLEERERGATNLPSCTREVKQVGLDGLQGSFL